MHEESTTQKPAASPLAGEPETVQADDAFWIFASELTPGRVRLAEALCGVTWLFALIAAGAVHLPLVPVVLVMLIALGFPLQRGMRALLRVQTVIVVSMDTLRVQRGGRAVTYDRTIEHSIVLLPHDRTREEQEWIETRLRRDQLERRSVAYTRYYGKSFHVALEYFGQRRDLLTVYDEKRARAVAARIKACDRLMDIAARMNDGDGMTPEEQWGEQPGGLPG